MSMSFWVIVSWVFVLLLTGVNVFLFLKLKSASEQMLKMAFPNAKNMGEALQSMQGMMSGMQGMMGGAGMGGMASGAGRPNNLAKSFGGSRSAKGANSDAQLKAAMDMLNKMQKK